MESQRTISSWTSILVAVLIISQCLSGATGLTSWAANITSEDLLLADLLNGYDERVRPVADPLTALSVTVFTGINQIISLDDRSQVLTISASINLMWSDVHLRWDSTAYGGITQTFLPIEDIWKPDLGIGNSVNVLSYDLSAEAKNRAVVYNYGIVLWIVTGVFEVSCKLDMTRFPFDTQVCPIPIISTTHLKDFLQLTTMLDDSSTLFYINSTEWDLVSAKQEVGDRSFPTEGSPTGYLTLSEFTLNLTLKRRTGYYWVHLISPCVFISLLVTMTFYMPSEAGEKISFSVTILLAFTVYQLIIAETLPKTSETTSLISIYLTLLIGLSATSVVLAMLVLNIHHHDPDKPVPNWAKTLVFRILAVIAFKRKAVAELKLETTTKIVQVQPSPSSDTVSMIGGSTATMTTDISTIIPIISAKEPEMRRVQFVMHNQDSYEQDNHPGSGKYANSWKVAAEILDRFFFMLFMLVTVVSSVVMLIIIPLT
ncbi:neuronal acetylcholine receptor subunit alpha-10-like [Lineus longissimus]|uniref:neuronal acetylcholine receptor subunit alpha-10-like n=1 Tax=Lineus longissimus TaxID=88925 RepID=UPI00315D3F99